MNTVPELRLKLYTLLATIPQNKVITYGELAKHLNTSPRAIGAMLAANQDLINIACYKVIHSDGRIGNYRGGVFEKIARLKADGIIIENDKVNLQNYGWHLV